MAINYHQLMSLRIPEVRQSYSHRDSLLYALSLGLGNDPLDPRQLPYVYEGEQRCLPTFGTVLGHPGLWLRDLDTGVDWVKALHAQQELILHHSLPAAANVLGQQQIVEVVDRGEGRGAMIVWQRRIIDTDRDLHLCTVNQYMLARGDGGFGGPPRTLPAVVELPAGAPDIQVEIRSSPQMALLYRLNGDWNPLHADPEVARKAGFDRPILHGLATWGLAATAVLDRVCDFDHTRIASVFGRFTTPVYPGETFRVDIWREPTRVLFRVVAVERDVIALNNGLIGLR